MTTSEAIKACLQQLSPAHLEVIDDSHKHVGHAGSKDGGGHYSILIVSNQFAGQNRLSRQRQINDLLSELFHQKIHALSIRALTPEEFSS